MKKIFPAIFCLAFSIIVNAKSEGPNHVTGDLIVQLQPEISFDSLKNFILQRDTVVANTIELKKILSKRMNIVLISFDTAVINEEKILSSFKSYSIVINSQYNHYIKQRNTTPNDAQYNQMWDLNNTGQSGNPNVDINAPEAWDISTGGVTYDGDSIVVADVDGGFDLNHEDINYWINYSEIQGNGVDDDGNGYIDDYRGWNAYDSNGTIPTDFHGTHTAGTIAAKGNNNIGITGIGWRTQLMPIAGSTGDESVAIEAYGYALDMRATYNTSIGQGAFVVATNSSFGVNYGQPSDYPIWCAMYDSLGKYGILSAGATANLNIDIDMQGDIPTACSSNFLISVTNTTSGDLRNGGAAYGLNTIDVGAPGTNTLSTTPNNNYGTLTGTSMATPHVAGTIGLIYSIPCKNFADSARIHPASTALKVKSFILNGVDTIPDLLNKTVSNGRLNLYKTLVLAMSYYGCGLTFAEDFNVPIDYASLYPNPTSDELTLEMISKKNEEVSVTVYNSIGDLIFLKEINTENSFIKYSFSTKDFIDGIYFVTLSTQSGKNIYHSKFFKK